MSFGHTTTGGVRTAEEGAEASLTKSRSFVVVLSELFTTPSHGASVSRVLGRSSLDLSDDDRRETPGRPWEARPTRAEVEARVSA